jgi:hypothetical protein
VNDLAWHERGPWGVWLILEEAEGSGPATRARESRRKLLLFLVETLPARAVVVGTALGEDAKVRYVDEL